MKVTNTLLIASSWRYSYSKAAFLFAFVAISLFSQAQVPNISYSTPLVFTKGIALTSVTPTNTGGAVPNMSIGITTFVGNAYPLALDGIGTDARVGEPRGLTFDQNGNIFLAEVYNNIIRKISPSGVVERFAGIVTGSNSYGSTDGPRLQATFREPQDVAFDASGNLYITDTNNHLIRKIDTNGNVSTFAGTGQSGWQNGDKAIAKFDSPRSIVFDNLGNMFVSDFNNHMIRKIDPDGIVLTFAGNSSYGSSDGTGFGATFNSPRGLAIDGSNNIYVADYNNHTIRKITPSGNVTTIVGSGSAGYADGQGTAASFNHPTDVAVDASGYIYVSDSYNSKIRKISPTGAVTTIADATFPEGLTVNSEKTLFVSSANRIMKINQLGYGINPALPVGMVLNSDGSISGTPTAASPATDYTITAVNGSGSSSVVVNFEVVNPPAPNISYASPQVFTVASAIATLLPTNSGGAVPGTSTYIYTVSPALPNGLAINAATGAITGTPTAEQAASNYTVTASNPNGSSDATISIRVAAPAPNISYASPKVYSAGVAIAGLTPTNTGGAVPGTSTYIYSSSPSLPSGLNLDAATGEITGTPTQASAATDYIITATNESGSSSATINIRVKPQAPNISLTAPTEFAVGAAISTLTPANSGGAVSSQTMVTTLAGSGIAGPDNGIGANASLNGPTSVIVDANGNLYVADFLNHLIRSVSANGAVGTIAGTGIAGSDNGNFSSASFNQPAGIALDGLGNFYVSDASNNIIRKISFSTGVTTFAGSGSAGFADGQGVAASFNSPLGIAADATGNVFVADLNNNRIRKITPQGLVSTLAGGNGIGSTDGDLSVAQFNYPAGLEVDAAGNIYVADAFNHKIRKISKDGMVTTLAGSGSTGSADGTGAAASFNFPLDVAVDSAGNVYVTDQHNNKIRKITKEGVVTTYAGTEVGDIDGISTEAAFNNPSGIAVDAAGYVYVTDQQNHKIKKITPAGYTISPALPAGLNFNPTTGAITGTPTEIQAARNYTITAFNETGKSSVVINFKVNGSAPNISYSSPTILSVGIASNAIEAVNIGGAVPTSGSIVSTFAGGTSGSQDGIAEAAAFNYPFGVATDIAENVYVADQYNHSIRKITPTAEVSTLAGNGTGISEEGTGTAAGFNTPMGVAVDNVGNVFVAEQFSNKIRRITPAGVTSTFAGSGLQGMDDGTGTAASFSQPMALALTKDGNTMYVADFFNFNIRKISASAEVSTFAGTGTQGAADGTGTAASFDVPTGLAVDADGNVFVADQVNNKIRKITPAGVVTTFAGSGDTGAADGLGTAASFNSPTDIAIDDAGNLYVTDQYNFSIRKITPAAVVSTIAGNGTDGAANGLGLQSSFSSPTGVAVDTKGNLYVADMFNNSIRKIALFGFSISPALPAGLVFNSVTGQISGTPTESRAATDYTITATNEYGSSTTVINISTDGLSTAVSDATSNAIRIYTVDGNKIAVAGIENSHVVVYNQIGQQVYNAKTNGVINQRFAKGIYIVRLGNIVSKVLIN